MWNPYSSVLLLESGLAVLFFSVILLLWQKVAACDAALWVLAWATRVFASLQGVQHLSPGRSGDLTAYMGLQACSACALILVLARTELRVLRERLVRKLFLQLSGVQLGASKTR
jgi:hypothetical protein